MSERHSVIPRTMSLIFYDYEVLLYKASKKKDWEGVYDPVGGHIEKGEDILHCANREILEETGLQVNDTKLKGVVHVTNFYGKNLMLFVTKSTSTTKVVNSSDEGELEWISLDKLDQINVHEDVKPIIELVLKMQPNEFFTATSEFDNNGKLLSLLIHNS